MEINVMMASEARKLSDIGLKTNSIFKTVISDIESNAEYGEYSFSKEYYAEENKIK